jgi:hypothetical protein
MFHIVEFREQNEKDRSMPVHKSKGRPDSDKITSSITKRVNANKRNARHYNITRKVPKRNELNGQADVTPNDGLNETSLLSSSFSNEESFSSTTKTPSDLTGESYHLYRNDEYEKGNFINQKPPTIQQESDSSDNESLTHQNTAKNNNYLANNNG